MFLNASSQVCWFYCRVRKWFEELSRDHRLCASFFINALVALVCVGVYLAFSRTIESYRSSVIVVLWGLVLLLSLKCVSIVNGIRWVIDRGQAFCKRIEILDYEAGCAECKKTLIEERIVLLREHGWRWWYSVPFGIMDNYLTNADWIRCQVIRCVVNAMRFVLYRVQHLVYAVVIVAIAAPLPLSPNEARAAVCVACVSVVMLLLMSSEIVLGNIEMKSAHSDYVRGYALRSVKPLRATSVLLLLHLVGLTVVTGAFGSLLLFKADCHAFAGVVCCCDSRISAIDRIVAFTYYSTTTLFTVGFGDIHPISTQSRIQAIAFELTGFMLIVFAVQVVIGTEARPGR